MKIRKHLETDREGIIHILQLNTPGYFAPEEEQDLHDYLSRHADNYYVAEQDNLIIACGGINFRDEDTAVLSWDIVHPQSQGKGVGSALTAFRLQKIKEMEGIRTVSVRTTQLTWQFYAKFGLQLRETIKDYWAPGFDMYRMDCKTVELTRV